MREILEDIVRCTDQEPGFFMRDSKFTPKMRKALKSGFPKRRIPSDTGKNTQRALEKRRLISKDGVLTSQGVFVVLEWLSLNNQCRELGLPLEELSYQSTSKPEIAAYKYFSERGYVGDFQEGDIILMVIQALCLDELTELNPEKSREDACRFLKAQFYDFELKKKDLEPLFEAIQKTSKERFTENFKEILGEPIQSPILGNEWNQEVDKRYKSYPDAAKAFYDAVGIGPLERVARKFASNPCQFGNGWPDLTLVKGNEVRFIEVKTGDNLHRSQLVTIPIMQPLLPATFSVLRMKKQG
ncbi:MAG: VRR-NUC domain-containing protein [Euryarchaeota archaeon]|nr:VRR-NUC domain-containing protein [Euryarchaeota archaeon]